MVLTRKVHLWSMNENNKGFAKIVDKVYMHLESEMLAVKHCDIFTSGTVTT